VSLVYPPSPSKFANYLIVTAGNGVYLDDCQFKRPSKWASDPKKAERLWELSEDLVGQKFSHEAKSRL
jgi:hypothetical protein